MLPLVVGLLQSCLSFWNDLCPLIVLSTPTYSSDKLNLLSRPPWPTQIPLSKSLSPTSISPFPMSICI